MVLLGEVDLDGIEGFAATTLYWCFIIFGFVIMLNALLAIVMDSFQTVRFTKRPMCANLGLFTGERVVR